MYDENTHLKIIFNIVFILLIGLSASAQKGRKIKLISANKLKSGQYEGKNVSRLLGNVQLKHEGKTMWCDSAYQFVKENTFFGFGNVKIQDTPSKYVTGNQIEYYGSNELAKIRGNVTLHNEEITLETDILDYYLADKKAFYYEGGTVKDEKSVLKSETGFFDDASHTFHFKTDVIVTQETDTILTDTLIYNTVSKAAYLYGPTTIHSENRDLYAEKGIYYTKEKIADFAVNAWVKTPEYTLYGDSLHYETNIGLGQAFRNVVLISFKDSVTIYGDEAYRDKKKLISKVYGNALMQKIEGSDTLFLKADTLISKEDTTRKDADIIAYHHVRLIQKDILGICDSLYYDFNDSTVYFYDSPVLWSAENQITADTLYAVMNKNGIDRFYADINSFIISEDTLLRFNQVKGRHLVGYFKNNNLTKVTIDGNGESLYYAYDEAQEMIGLNKSISANMTLYFKENKLETINFLQKPDANFIPPQKLNQAEEKLKNFKWMIDQRPNKAFIYQYLQEHTRSSI